MTLSVVNTSVRLDHEGGVCKDIAIALGSMAPTPIRCCQAEASLKGKPLNVTNIQSCAKIAAGEAKPIDDQRATAWYRREACSALVERAIKDIAGTLTH
jgi:carbon-monoxide dehydrogenase medium subunit